MTTPSKPLPDWCCASGCPRCGAWARYSIEHHNGSLRAEWCLACNETTCRADDGRCVPCKPEVPSAS